MSKKPSQHVKSCPPAKMDNPESSPFQILQQSLATLHSHFSSFIKSLSPNPNPSLKSPPWARVAAPDLRTRFPMQQPGTPTSSTNGDVSVVGERAMSVAEIESRLDGVTMYTTSNKKGEIVLIEDKRRRRDDDGKEKKGMGLALMYLREEDAAAALEEMRGMDEEGRFRGSKVVPVPLKQVFQLKVDGVAFRLVPEASQIVHALKEKLKEKEKEKVVLGFHPSLCHLQEMGRTSSFDKTFSGIPIFESPNLTLMTKDKRYLPLFFRKEDLEKSLQRARQRMSFSFPAREGDIQVAALEEIIEGMKDPSSSKWDDAVFVPPGYDIPTDISQLKKLGQR
ncbi:TIC 22-like, chloroplastic-like protein [Drosera capensis]